MSRSLFAAVAALLVLASPAFAAHTDIKKVTSAQGVTAWLVEDHSVPLISMSFDFKGGAALDPTGKEGLANFVSDTLDEGAGDLDSQTFQGREQDLAIGIDFGVSQDDFTGRLRTVTANRDTAFNLLALALNKPRFDQDAVDRVRKQELAGLQNELDDPDTIAARAMDEVVFAGHPYARPADGTPTSVAAITRDDMVGWVQHHLGRDRLVVSVVGDITADQLKPLLDQVFGGLPATTDAATVPEAKVQGGGTVKVVKRDIPQSVVVFAGPGIMRKDPDWYAAFVLNQILGGGTFTSRLMSEVRLKRGLAYETYSYLSPHDHGAIVGGGVATRNEAVADSIKVFKQTWGQVGQEGATAKEVNEAKTYLNGSFPLQMGSTAALAALLTTIQTEDLGFDYLDRRSKLIDAVTPADVLRVAKRLLDPAQLATVVVGNPAGMQ